MKLFNCVRKHTVMTVHMFAICSAPPSFLGMVWRDFFLNFQRHVHKQDCDPFEGGCSDLMVTPGGLV